MTRERYSGFGGSVPASLVAPPANVANTFKWTAVATGPHHTCAIAASSTASNNVWCWGLNEFGEVGNGKSFVDPPPQTTIAVP